MWWKKKGRKMRREPPPTIVADKEGVARPGEKRGRTALQSEPKTKNKMRTRRGHTGLLAKKGTYARWRNFRKPSVKRKSLEEWAHIKWEPQQKKREGDERGQK